MNGEWLRTTDIPADRSGFGTFDMLADKSATDVRTIVEELDAAADEPGSESQKIADLYASFMDSARVDTLGAAPLAQEFTRIDAIATSADLVAYFGQRAKVGLPSPVSFGVSQDARNATLYVAGADQGGLTMPDREYYLTAEPRFAMIRDGFRGYVGSC